MPEPLRGEITNSLGGEQGVVGVDAEWLKRSVHLKSGKVFFSVLKNDLISGFRVRVQVEDHNEGKWARFALKSCMLTKKKIQTYLM